MNASTHEWLPEPEKSVVHARFRAITVAFRAEQVRAAGRLPAMARGPRDYLIAAYGLFSPNIWSIVDREAGARAAIVQKGKLDHE